MSRIAPVHAGVPGRVRLKVAGLRRSPRLKRLMEEGLAVCAGVLSVSASIETGNLLILFDEGLELNEVVSFVEALLDQSSTSPARKDAARQAGEFRRGEEPRPWHAVSAEEAVDALGGDPRAGLSEQEAAERLRRFGPNALAAPRRRSGLAIFAGQFNSFPIAVLAGSAVLSLASGGALDALFIMSVVLINSGIGYVTESQTERIIGSLGGLVKPSAAVIREGAEHKIRAEEVVVGDLLTLTPGAFVAADARLIEAEDLSVNEAALTGESLPALKTAETLDQAGLAVADRLNMVYKGTAVTGGQGVAIVTATGRSTEIGKVQALVREAVAPETPMQRQLNHMGRQLVWMTGGACAAVLGLGAFHGAPFLDTLKTTIALAVAAIPEGLPTVAVTTLALGARQLQQRNVLMRRLDAVETLGSVQAMCFDKTGTLTFNTMSVAAVHVASAAYRVEGEQFFRDGDAVAPLSDPVLTRLFEVGALCSEAEIRREGECWKVEGSATERALVETALKAGVDVETLRQRAPIAAVRRRNERKMFMSTIHVCEGGRRLAAVKGAPMEVLALCRWRLQENGRGELTAAMKSELAKENERMANSGLRVLGFAFAESEKNTEDFGRGLIWLGLAGMTDPLRPGMRALLAAFRQAGVRTIMVTGDQSATAYAIARRVEISGAREIRVLDASDIQKMEPEMLAALAPRADVFARISPAHKLHIVQALQKSGMVVAMTGDGVNDGPALKAADIGVAMGRAGTDVAHEVADVVLMDDDLRGMASAVSQGRTLYGNVRKAIRYILSTNASETLTVLAATAVNAGQPLTPMQLLWINLISEVFPGLALTMEPAESDVMKRPPRDPAAPIVAASEFPRLGFEAAAMATGSLAAYGYGLSRFGPGPQASAMAFHSLVISQLLHSISARSTTTSIFRRNNRPANPYLNWALAGSFAAQTLTVAAPSLRSLLGVAPLGLGGFLAVLAGGTLPLLINETTKSWPAGASQNSHADVTTTDA
jgi:Ca2+-transporting ATPase